jgi:Tol biopolymer transport system component
MNGLRLVYSSNYTGNREIYSRNLQTGRTENLTNNPADDANPTVSSDGSFVTFDSNRGSNGARNIYRIDMTTSEKRAERLSSGKNDSKPAYIGDKVVYVSKDSDGRGDIWAMGASGSNPQNLTAGRPKTAEDNPTALGDKVLFTSEFKPGVASSTELFRVNLDGSQPTRLTNDNVAQLDPTYSAKANSIAYVSHEDGGKGLPQVYTAPYMANTLGPSEKFTDEAAGATDPSWAFDGRALAFVAGGNIEGTLDGTTTLVLDQPPVTGAGITNADPYLGHLAQ